MWKPLVICCIAILALPLLSTDYEKSKVVSGRVYASTDKAFYSVENLQVIISSKKRLIDTVQTNAKGEFLVSIPDSIDADIDLSYYGVGFQMNYLGHIKRPLPDTTRFVIDLAKKYRKNVFGKAYCLKCGKSDLVYRVHYSDAPVYTLRVSKSGDTLSNAIKNGVFQAGTCVSSAQSAQWYCDRDKIIF